MHKEFYIDKESHTGLGRNGKSAGFLDNCGYYRASFKGKKYLVHRIVYHLHTGKPLSEIPLVDHVDRVRTNNCPSNLRELTKADNNRNRKPATGVSYCKQTGKWKASRGDVWLGRFPTKELAALAVADV
ncbi:hypothetical protein PflCFBP13517_18390 [Pseudomonas fluorescens]|nr:hypothetical protein PflCFBP13517_18390 [Pseudomonas fluorescens]